MSNFRCPEVWDDEIGCDVPGPHECQSLGDQPHRVHICRDCSAMVITDKAVPDASH